jgi:glyoxylase-like metal-dependent hydrolase (beta-lactamase superfamily II)
MELVKGVYQITLPLEEMDRELNKGKLIKTDKENLIRVIEQKVYEHNKPFTINVYLIEGNRENLLIDTGMDSPAVYALLNDELKKYGFDIKDINHIVITHIHPDHYGLAGKLKQLSGAKIAFSDAEAAMLDSRYIKMDALVEEMRDMLYASGAPAEMLSNLSRLSLPLRRFVTPVLPDVKLKDGKKITIDPFEFKVLLTPGHSVGHICLYEQNRKLLFCGDHILPEITPHIGFHPQAGPDPLGDYLKSLKNMLKLEVRLAFPGHGPSFSGLRQRIEELLRHHEYRNTEVMETIQDDVKTPYQIASEITWLNDSSKGNFRYMEEFNQRMAIMETVAHLRHLLKENKVTRVDKNGIDYYHAV